MEVEISMPLDSEFEKKIKQINTEALKRKLKCESINELREIFYSCFFLLFLLKFLLPR